MLNFNQFTSRPMTVLVMTTLGMGTLELLRRILVKNQNNKQGSNDKSYQLVITSTSNNYAENALEKYLNLHRRNILNNYRRGIVFSKLESDDDKRIMYSLVANYTYKLNYSGKIINICKTNGTNYPQIELSCDCEKLLQKFLNQVSSEFYQNHNDTNLIRLIGTDSNNIHIAKLNVRKNFNNMCFPEQISEKIKYIVANYRDIFRKRSNLGTPRKIGVLLSGYAGCGKTSTAYCMSHETGMKLYKIRDLDNLFEKVLQIEPNSIVLFDDIDKIKGISDTSDENKDGKIGNLLEILDGYHALDQCIVLISTNRPDNIHPELLRFGRVDYHLKFGPVQDRQVQHAYNLSFDAELDMELCQGIAQSGLSMADITGIFGYYGCPEDALRHLELLANERKEKINNDLKILEEAEKELSRKKQTQRRRDDLEALEVEMKINELANNI